MDSYEGLIGFRFTPKGFEVISAFLAKRLVGLSLPENKFYDDVDIYLYHPEQIPCIAFPGREVDRRWAYFFLFKTPEEDEERRVTPCGYREEIQSEKVYNYESWKQAAADWVQEDVCVLRGRGSEMTDWWMEEEFLT